METPELDPRLNGYRKWEGFEPFEEQSGPFYFRRDGDGKYQCAFISGPCQTNSHGHIHGGALMTFADYSLFVFARPCLRGITAVTVSCTIDFTAAGRPGQFIESTGEVVYESRSLIFVRGTIYCGATTLAVISGVLKKTRSLKVTVANEGDQ